MLSEELGDHKQKLVHDDSDDGILAKVLRGEQEFDASPRLHTGHRQGSTNYKLLGDYAMWFVNCGD